MMARNKYLLFFLFLILTKQSLASHTVGYDFFYNCLGGNNYQFTLKVYRDCLPPRQGGGNPNAIASDDPAYINIFDGNSVILRFKF